MTEDEQAVEAMLARAEQSWRSIDSVNLSNRGLKLVPARLAALTHLKSLYMDNNKLIFIAELAALAQLEELSLENNEITLMPESCCRAFRSLKTLNLSRNSLKCLSGHSMFAASAFAAQLTVLWLNECGLLYLPKEIGCLTALEKLGLKSNRLEQLPDEFGRLVRLKWLSLESNELSELPDEAFAHLKALSHLNVSHNKLERLPDCLAVLSRDGALNVALLRANLIAELHDAHVLELGSSALHKLDLRDNPCVRRLRDQPDQASFYREIKTLDNFIIDDVD